VRSGKSLSLIGENEWYGDCATLTERGSEGRLPMYWQVDFHLGYDFPIPGKVKFRLTADIFNLFNTKIEVRRDIRYLRNTYFGTPSTLMPWDFNLTDYPEPDNEFFGKGIEYQTPFRMRLGFEIRF
jgi:outer membrane receptor protein involved in Fe transport